MNVRIWALLCRWPDEIKSGENALVKYKANLETLFTRLVCVCISISFVMGSLIGRIHCCETVAIPFSEENSRQYTEYSVVYTDAGAVLIPSNLSKLAILNVVIFAQYVKVDCQSIELSKPQIPYPTCATCMQQQLNKNCLFFHGFGLYFVTVEQSIAAQCIYQ